MEDALVRISLQIFVSMQVVLILVLMEDALVRELTFLSLSFLVS